jgi:hypothetical protein
MTQSIYKLFHLFVRINYKKTFAFYKVQLHFILTKLDNKLKKEL